ncbi:MAG: hypothetical protein ACI9NY_001874 [Kiritimatiellia bacterium]|jgi:hypothetical protein
MKTMPKGLYRHYKGQEYQVLDLARHSETQEWLVVYRCLYDDYSLWVRPYDMFVETVNIEGKALPRFNFVKCMDEDMAGNYNG